MNTILEMRSIGMTFPGVKALDDVNLRVRSGEIHAIMGENGAGKSTLMKILSGVYPWGSYSGSVLFQGQEQHFKDIGESESSGIVIIHQELALVPMLSIAENIFLGNEQNNYGVIDRAGSYRKTQQLLEKVGLKEAPATLVSDIGVGKQQLVEIAKALAKEVSLLILDEPTASLSEEDSQALLDLLLGLKHEGITSILISHKLNEIARVADTITVLRDGKTVDTFDCGDGTVSEDRIIQSMVGRTMEDRYPARKRCVGEPILEVRNWQVYHPLYPNRRVIHDVHFTVRRGEILGFAGLVGAGRTELAMSLFGGAYGRHISGDVLLRGQPIDISTIPKAISHGIAYVTEDRKTCGLLLEEGLTKNITLANLSGISKHLVIDEQAEDTVAMEYLQRLSIRCANVHQKVMNLSGGNQQKVVLAKWLFSNPDVLILDEPTRGIDVGAKYEIYSIMGQLAEAGKCIILISSEMSELLGMCDRILVMNDGKVVGEFQDGDASQENIMRAIVKNEEWKM